MLEIPINTTKDKIFEQYLYIINPVLNKNKLTDIEVKVLAKLLYVYHMYISLGREKANMIVFNAETKKRIRTAVSSELGSIFSVNSFNNSISKLKKKGMIKDNTILIRVPYNEGEIKIGFKLKINE